MPIFLAGIHDGTFDCDTGGKTKSAALPRMRFDVLYSQHKLLSRILEVMKV